MEAPGVLYKHVYIVHLSVTSAPLILLLKSAVYCLPSRSRSLGFRPITQCYLYQRIYILLVLQNQAISVDVFEVCLHLHNDTITVSKSILST